MKNVLAPVTRIDLDEAFEAYDEKNRGYRDQILTGLDRVMKELETIREETTVGVNQVTEKVDEHEQRITKLEISRH